MQIDGGPSLCQTKYIDTLLQHFGLEDYKPIATPMEPILCLSLHESSDAFNVFVYQKVVGWLIYVCITRLDIQALANSQVYLLLLEWYPSLWVVLSQVGIMATKFTCFFGFRLGWML